MQSNYPKEIIAIVVTVILNYDFIVVIRIETAASKYDRKILRFSME